MARKELAVDSVAEAYLALLAERGIEYLFANAGTDFAPIVEAYAKAARTGMPVPKPLLATHENLAISMAHGYAVASRPGAGGHGACQRRHRQRAVRRVQRGARECADPVHRRPLAADRGAGCPGRATPTSTGRRRCSTRPACCARSSNGNTSCATAQQLETVVDRALTVATSPPEGPVYLSLPREVLAAPLPGFAYDAPARRVAAVAARRPTRARSTRRRGSSRRRENPLIVTAECRPRPARRSTALADFAERFAIPVVEHRPRHLCLPADHPCHLGYNPGALSRRCRRDPRPRMRCAVDPEPQGAAPGMQGHPYRRRSAVHAAIRSAAFRAMSRSPAHRGWRCRSSARRSTGMSPTRRVAARRQRVAERREAMRPAGGRRATRRGEHAPDPHGLGQRLHRRGAQAGGCDPRQRIHPDARALRLEPAGQLFRVEPGLGARLGRRRRARRQARRARPAGHRRPRRRLVPVRQPGRGAPRRRRCTNCRCCSSS